MRPGHNPRPTSPKPAPPPGPPELARTHAVVIAAKQVEEWWVREGQHIMGGAPACIFNLREALHQHRLTHTVRPGLPQGTSPT